jgi:hypothetical protein
VNKSETIEKIAPALHKAQGQIKAALKDSRTRTSALNTPTCRASSRR